MLHKETVEARTLDLIQSLMDDPALSDFVMVGGTALSLLIGHRISIDIDLFIQTDFNSDALRRYMETKYNMSDSKVIKNGLFGFIDDIKIDLISHQYPLLEKTIAIEGVRIISLRDIGAMKLQAIFQNGSRLKDFIDVYFLLERFSFQQLVEGYEEKYPDVSASFARAGLTYFEDIDYSVPIKMIQQQIPKEEMQNRLKDAVIHPQKIFKSPLHMRKDKKKQSRKHRGL